MRRILIGLALTLIALPAWAQTQVEQAEAEAAANDCVAHKDDPYVCKQLAKFLVDKGYKEYEQKSLYDEAIRFYRAALKTDPTNDAAKQGLIRLGATP
jgi:tetratricopeptide (TPR) repeat protein